MKKVFLAAVTAALICMQTVSFSAVDDAELNSQADSNSSEITEKENENDTLMQEITDLNKDIESTRLDIAKLEESISQSNADIKELNKDIDDNKEQLKSRICAIYMAGSTSNLELILGAQDFNDLLDKLEYVSVITKHDTAMINTLSQQVNTSKQTKQNLTNSKKELEEKSNSLLTKRNSFENLLKSNQERLNYLYGANQDISDMLSPNNSPEYAQLEQNLLDYYNGNDANNTDSQTTPTEKSSSSKGSSSSKNNKPSQNNTKPTKAPTSPPQNNSGSSDTDYSGTDTSGSSTGNQGGSTTNTPSSTGYIWPVPGFYHLTSLWDEDRGSSNHGALDIASGGIEGAKVIASRSGTVWSANNDCVHNWGKDSSCGCGGGYGNYVMLDHGDGHMTVYAHMSSIAVSAGDYVEAGQLLGFVGSTGYSTGAHLHFETRLNGEKYNPLNEFPGLEVTW